MAVKHQAQDGSLHETREGAANHDQVNDMILDAAGKGSNTLIAFLLIVPSLLVLIFEQLFIFSFKAKRVGRVIQTVIMGFIIGLIITLAVGGVHRSLPGLLYVVIGTAFFILPALWYYCSHYFTLKAAMYDERFLDGGKIKEMFLIPFTILFYGEVVMAVIGLIARFIYNKRLPGFLYAIPLIAVAVLYIKNTLSSSVRKGAKVLKKEEGRPLAGMIIALVFASIIPFLMLTSNAGKAAERNKEQARYDAKLTKLSGQSLTVNAPALNLRAEASGAGRVIKTLSEGGAVTATGTVSGLWVPVEAGSDKGFVFAPFVTLDDKSPIEDVVPFEAVAAAPIQLYKLFIKDRAAHELPEGTVVTVVRITNDSIIIEHKNVEYKLYPETAEALVPKLNANDAIITLSTDTPAEFKRKKAPFYAVVTEDIEVENGQIQVPIPAGTSIPVKAKLRTQAEFQNNAYGTGYHYIYWKYLKLED